MNTEVRAADSILDRGVRFRMPAPWFLRLFGFHRIRVKRQRLGTILTYSKTVLKHGLNDEMNADEMRANLDHIAECVAITVLNGRLKIKLFKKMLTRWYLWRCHYTQLMEMFIVLQRINQIQDFTPITRFYSHQTKMMMSPKNLGQNENGR